VVYAIYSLLTHLPLVVVVLLLPLLLCCGRMLLQPRGPLRPYKIRDAMCGCGGHCQDCLQALRGACCGGESGGGARLVSMPASIHLGGGARGGGGGGGGRGAGAEMVRVRSLHGDALDEEETQGFLA